MAASGGVGLYGPAVSTVRTDLSALYDHFFWIMCRGDFVWRVSGISVVWGRKAGVSGAVNTFCMLLTRSFPFYLAHKNDIIIYKNVCKRGEGKVAELTPMMQQYMQTKKEYPDCILFYRLGDFYEMFFDDALTASRELEITLTGKNCGLEERAPMCGVPYHAVDGYLNRLVSKGYKVAICEQVEDPETAKGLVKREVVRIATPGTNLDMQALDETKNNYIMCVVYIEDRFGMSIADVTTGEYLVTEVGDSE